MGPRVSAGAPPAPATARALVRWINDIGLQAPLPVPPCHQDDYFRERDPRYAVARAYLLLTGQREPVTRDALALDTARSTNEEDDYDLLCALKRRFIAYLKAVGRVAAANQGGGAEFEDTLRELLAMPGELVLSDTPPQKIKVRRLILHRNAVPGDKSRGGIATSP